MLEGDVRCPQQSTFNKGHTTLQSTNGATWKPFPQEHLHKMFITHAKALLQSVSNRESSWHQKRFDIVIRANQQVSPVDSFQNSFVGKVSIRISLPISSKRKKQQRGSKNES